MRDKGTRPLVSVITPSYNQGAFIEETIKSVLSQDYPSIEYIVMDGGSTDNTLAVLRKYEGRLKWVSQKDKGQSDAIDSGFKKSKGEILAWLNSDDTYLPGAVKRVVEFFNSHPDVSMLYGKTYYTNEGGTIVGEHGTRGLDVKELAVNNFICQPSVFFKREAYLGAGGLDLSLRYAMDYDLWLRMLKNYRMEYLPEYFSTYRLHGESKTVSSKHALANSREVMETVLKYYGWAPLGRVYVYWHDRLKAALPEFAARQAVLFPLSIGPVLFSYLRLNRGVDSRDLKAVSFSNLKKIISGRKWFE